MPRWFAGAVLLGCTLWPAAAPAQSFERLASWVQSELQTDDAPSLAVAVARDGRILWEAGFGWADRERKVPATPHTRYSLASVSKPLTASGLMLLVDEARVDLDRPVNAYLTSRGLQVRVGAPDEVTVRRLANHTAGLPLHHHFFVEGERKPPPMPETIARYGIVMFPPGERYRYSNLGYGVLQQVIEDVASAPWAEFMRARVFEPLGMVRSSVGIPAAERGDYAVRYAADASPLPYYDVDHPGASAIFSSAHDLALFGLLHVGSPLPAATRILSPAAVAAMQRLTVKVGEAGGYGIGWQIARSRRGIPTIRHGGGMPGVTAWLTLVPAAKLAIVALSNGRSALPEEITERALDMLLPPGIWAVDRGLDLPAAREPRVSRKPGRRLVGSWTGHADTSEGRVSLGLRIGRDGTILARLADDEQKAVGTSFQGDLVRGFLRGLQLQTRDTRRLPHVLQLELTRRGQALTGALTAAASSDEVPGFALAHWVELQRVDDAR